MNDGKDFVIRVIQYLEYKHHISFFITPVDFDVVYRWFEKHIPLYLVKESIDTVVARRIRMNKPTTKFSVFYGTVKKNYEALTQMNVGENVAINDSVRSEDGKVKVYSKRSDGPGTAKKSTKRVGETAPENAAPVVQESKYKELEDFFLAFPSALDSLRCDYDGVFALIKENANEAQCLEALEEVNRKLLALFEADPEIGMKVKIFLGSLAKPLRTVDMANRYRLNYIINNCGIPDFELYFPA